MPAAAAEPIATSSPLQVQQIDHVSVLITDVAKSRHFYRDLLGLKEMPKPKSFDFVALWFDLGPTQLHLLQKEKPDSISPRHFALRVPDVNAVRKYLRERGVAFEETTVIPGADRVFVRDPDGNRIEIIHWAQPYGPHAYSAKLDQ